MSGIDIPGFELIEKIGAGGMASVWKARQISLNRVVAIKILYSKFASDPSDVQRFQSEAQAAARLKHHGIVQVYDANAVGDMYFFVMEYVAGYTVGEWLKRKGVLEMKDALLVAECVVDALDYAWREAGIIHCDVKPDNVLIDSDGSVKVSDLGLARTLSQMLLESASDEIMGTPAYISPEQARGDAELDFRADIYSLGATLYHLVTGTAPFAGNEPESIMDMQVTSTVPDPRDVNPAVTIPVAWLIEKMMCKDPAGRQSSWGAVRADIQRAKQGLRPAGEPLPEGVSTVERGRLRAKMSTAAHASPVAPSRAPSTLRQFLNLVLVLGIGVLALVMYLRMKEMKSAARVQQGRPLVAPRVDGGRVDGTAAAPAVEAAGTAYWASEYQNALEWTTDNPGRYDQAAEMFRRVAVGAVGTSYASLAKQRVDALVREKQQRIDGVLAELSRVAMPLIEGNRFQEAAKVYSGYSGAFAAETATTRAAKAKEYLDRVVEVPPDVATNAEPLDAVVGRVADALLGGNLQSAVESLDAMLASPAYRDREADLRALREQVAGAAAAAQRMLDSFAEQKGQRVTVELRTGARELLIQDVNGERIVAVVAGAAATDGPNQKTVEFNASYLSFRERLKRMGPLDDAGAMLTRGLLAREAKSTETARRYLSQVSPLIADRLLAGLPTAP